jgi:hypothetical protein
MRQLSAGLEMPMRRAVGREPGDAPAWTEVDRIGLSAVRCPAAVEQGGAWSGRWSGIGGGLALRADTKEEATLCVGGGEASRFGLLHDVSQGIRTRAAHATGGHRRRTITICGVARARGWDTGNRVRTVKRLLRLTSGPGFIS